MKYDWHNKTILIIEDDATSNEFFREVFNPTGAKVILSTNGKEGIDIFKNNKIDIVLLDIQLPGINGIDVLKAIKIINNKIPIIAETAYALNGDREKLISIGFDEFIAKPILPNDLLKIVAKFL